MMSSDAPSCVRQGVKNIYNFADGFNEYHGASSVPWLDIHMKEKQVGLFRVPFLPLANLCFVNPASRHPDSVQMQNYADPCDGM